MAYSATVRDATASTEHIDSAALRLTDLILGYSEQDLVTILKLIATEIGVRHIAYCRLASNKSTDASLFTAIVTFSPEWQSRYFLKQYINIDPVLSQGANALLPFDWEVLRRENPSSHVFFDDAAKFGIGPSGLSIPVRN